MVRILLLAGLLLGAFHTQAEARTVRYEFDVTGFEMYYGTLFDISTTTVQRGTAEHDAFVAAYHPLRNWLGQTGPVSFELTLGTAPAYDNRFTCLSGFLCPGTQRFYLATITNDGFTAMGGFEWYLDGTELRFFDDGNIMGQGDLNGTRYRWMAPHATFTLANLTITDVTGQTQIASTPLPAALWLYAGLGLLLLRRRRG